MPFTPFHLGPALAIGLPLRRWIHAPTFIIASVAVDVEPLLVLVLGLSYPLHGYLHTFLGAAILGLAIAYAMYLLEGVFAKLWRGLLLEDEACRSVKRFIIAGISGTELHVLLDAPLYTDIKPLYPYTHNPFFNPSLANAIYGLCLYAGIAGIAYYIALAVSTSIRRSRSR